MKKKIGSIIFIALSFLQCKDEKMVYAWTTPQIDSNNKLVGYKTLFFDSKAELIRSSNKIFAFDVEKIADPVILQKDSIQPATFIIRLYFPFTFKTESLDLGLNIMARLDTQTNKVNSWAAQLEGADYPNGGLSGKTVAFSNDSLLTITSSIEAHWRINFIHRVKSEHLANFKNNYINHVSDTIEIKTNLFSYENQSPAIIENSGSTTTIQLSVEFSFNKKTRRGKIRVWKNGTLMADQLLFFVEPSLEIKSGQVLKMPV